jgi:hypothetical protein
MQLDHLLPLVPEMLPQRPANGNQPSVGLCRCRCVSCEGKEASPLERRSTSSLIGLVLALLLAACSLTGQATRLVAQPSGHRQHRGLAAHSPLPRHALTPGVALAVGRARVCTPGYASSVRDVSESDKAAVYDRYGVVWVPYKHEVDHLISLELGGSNAIRNLWPEPYAGRWGARTKDTLENRLHDLVCEGRLKLRSAQRQEARDWIAAYRKYMGATPTAGESPGSSPGGFYASSYPTASTIYCADDPTWHELSPAHLVHFATFDQTKARFPDYHLHQSCVSR